jgi:hypothetical protein
VILLCARDKRIQAKDIKRLRCWRRNYDGQDNAIDAADYLDSEERQVGLYRQRSSTVMPIVHALDSSPVDL